MRFRSNLRMVMSMTTIACNQSLMAGDSLAYDSDSGVKSRSIKLWRVGDVIIGGAGTAAGTELFAKWWKSGKKGDQPTKPEYKAIVLYSSGKIEIWAEDGPGPDRVLEPYTAVGSGAQAAMAAMLCGRSPVEAIRIASKIDLHTGGRVQVMRHKK
jgi:ATP-dependent protease HslVU (ClpYQ) peptidase subunit